jgi:hypothetical protein
MEVMVKGSKGYLDIYKEQKALREALEGELKRQGVDGQGKVQLIDEESRKNC